MKTASLSFSAALFGLLLATFLPSTGRGADAETVQIETAKGIIQITLDAKAAPKNVAAFKSYIAAKVYDGSSFHFLGQKDLMGGKPGPLARQKFGASGNMAASAAPPGEFALKHTKGIVSLGRTVGSCNPDKRSNSTQFSITLEDEPEDNGEYTGIGYVTQGMDIVAKIAQELKTPEGKKAGVPIKEIRLKAP